MWIDDVVAVPLRDYEVLRSRWFEHFERTDGVCAWGSFGSVSTPGLSDLDLIAVVEDELLAAGGFRLLTLDAAESRIMVHPPLVVPRSLYADLALYHPVRIEWAGGDDFAQPDYSPLVSLLHVIEKTTFVQARLRAAGAGDPSLRNLFLMLTSLARSVEWIERAGVPLEAAQQEYAREVLRLRSEWGSDPAARPTLQGELDRRLDQARRIAADLPERVARRLLGREGAAGRVGDLLQARPLRFIRRTAATASAPDGPGRRRRGTGETRSAGPALYEFLLARCGIEHELGMVEWPLLVASHATANAVAALPDDLRSALHDSCRVNREYFRALQRGGLLAAYFGTMWRAEGWRRTVKLALARGPGRFLA